MSEPGSRPRVLVLDDDPMVVRSTERVLRRAFDVTATSSIASAVSLARSESFAVFVTDYNLGNVTGFDVAQQVLEVAVRAPTIVVFSGVQGDEVPAGAAALGFLFVRKSDGPAVLREAVVVVSERWERAST
jgi:DNA-binding NtrC family response regulator